MSFTGLCTDTPGGIAVRVPQEPQQHAAGGLPGAAPLVIRAGCPVARRLLRGVPENVRTVGANCREHGLYILEF